MPSNEADETDRLLNGAKNRGDATLGSTLTGTQLDEAGRGDIESPVNESDQFWVEREARFPNVKLYDRNWGSYMIKRMLTEARTVTEYVTAVEWKDRRNWAESRVLAAVIDDMLSEFGIDKVRNFQGCESALRRIEALRLGDQTGNWDVAKNDLKKLSNLVRRDAQDREGSA